MKKPNPKLPKYWVVKNDGSQLFKDTVLKYLNKTYDQEFAGCEALCNAHYGFDGNTGSRNGTDFWWGTVIFQNNPTVLTLQEFIKLTTEPEVKEKHQFKEGDGVECSSRTEAMRLAKIAHDNGFSVYKGMLIDTTYRPGCIRWTDKEYFAGCATVLGRKYTSEEFIKLVTQHNKNQMKEKEYVVIPQELLDYAVKQGLTSEQQVFIENSVNVLTKKASVGDIKDFYSQVCSEGKTEMEKHFKFLTNKLEFPILMEAINCGDEPDFQSFVVLFSNETKGTVVYSSRTDNSLIVGEYCAFIRCTNTEHWRPYSQTIELSNKL